MGFRINRNIVECKSSTFPVFLKSGCPVLIETLWNVNISGTAAVCAYGIVLIETLWNVNKGL